MGRAQADRAAGPLAALAPVRLLSSDLDRARSTAAPLAEVTGLEVTLDARLRELDLGAWQGLTGQQARERFPDEHAAWRSGADVRRGGGETYAEAAERAGECLLEHLPDVEPGGTLVAVTHGGTARACVGRLLELPSASWGRLAPLGNCCWSVLVEHPAGWRLEQHGAGLDVAPATVTGADRRPL
ncbi:MAG: hypothetical protein AVDCRST_MAG07-759 [uncultured Frankineae bacterium]|uniref:Phosphoglycerate mutase n=1 Tax=uncultured Frankineae bacterium TaxID=437475 RepID=A0A6J4KRP7_9ACTN|nr:MAG: hypothetical protein AVDCRST_MAG07-759 [uncultured Frankineae bacterium]